MSNLTKELSNKVVNEDYSVRKLPTEYVCRKCFSHPVRDIHSLTVKRPFIVNTVMEPSRTDQSFNRPMFEVIKEFELAGKTLADIRSAKYDFEDGTDTGMSVGIARRRNVEFEDVSAYQKQVDASLAENLANDVNTVVRKKEKEKKETISPEPTSQASTPDKEGVTA